MYFLIGSSYQQSMIVFDQNKPADLIQRIDRREKCMIFTFPNLFPKMTYFFNPMFNRKHSGSLNHELEMNHELEKRTVVFSFNFIFEMI